MKKYRYHDIEEVMSLNDDLNALRESMDAVPYQLHALRYNISTILFRVVNNTPKNMKHYFVPGIFFDSSVIKAIIKENEAAISMFKIYSGDIESESSHIRTKFSTSRLSDAWDSLGQITKSRRGWQCGHRFLLLEPIKIKRLKNE